MEYASILRQHIENLVPLSDEAFEIVLNGFIPVSLSKKEYLIKVGQKVSAEYFVVQGCLKTAAYDDADKEHIIQFAMENWWVSDYPAYAKQGNADMDVQALEDCFVLALTMEARAEIGRQVPQMLIFWERKALGGYVATQKRVLSLLRNSAKEKYELLLDQYPQLFQRVPKKMIAHYLGVSRETLSRLHKYD
ncbi:Crp/Fnr family transcriptional regulator [Chitinophaga silvisoli]|uniref:Crp/Fnr family transcriptional regulator n=1 Tax=Chitinophaga silvisoli TaxID=2291814 RepID=A0A3E1NTZ1_9BACT|nr:Crp/Fnr family transcriptional regulator [Chitinophaga silvisoli]RFM31377.1 Crp/Fnr family transcriptional regulator [Chitinophaga silvisoli]